MESDFEIRSSVYPYNMTNWCIEKSITVMSRLARVVHELRLQNEAAPNQAIMNMLYDLYPALNDGTKILAFSCGAVWSKQHPELIFNEGYPGFEKVASEYGILDETNPTEQEWRPLAEELNTFLSEIKTLLDGPRSPSRTLIHQRISSSRLRSPVIEQIDQLVDSVTMGETDWESFTLRAKQIIEEHTV